jgi:hypothetical protein
MDKHNGSTKAARAALAKKRVAKNKPKTSKGS